MDLVVELLANNLHRRHLSPSQRAAVAAELVEQLGLREEAAERCRDMGSIGGRGGKERVATIDATLKSGFDTSAIPIHVDEFAYEDPPAEICNEPVIPPMNTGKATERAETRKMLLLGSFVSIAKPALPSTWGG